MTSAGSVPRRVVAIGLDSAEWSLIERHVAAGALPNMARLLRNGSHGELHGPDLPEQAWAEILTGCTSRTIGFAAPLAIRRDYQVNMIEAYDFAEFRPFYAYCPGRRAIVFDIPQARLAARVAGAQILGWGSHSPLGPSCSDPPGLLRQVHDEFGPHPAFAEDWMTVPETARKRAALERAYLEGLARREAICLALMRRQEWDLLFVSFGETHAAGHALWHLTRADHPLESLYRGEAMDAMLTIHRAIDRVIGSIVAAAGDGARIALFSSNGMKANATELGSLVFLPELLYRVAFKRPALAVGRSQVPPRRIGPAGDWGQLVWAMQCDDNPLRRAVRRHTGLGLGRRIESLLGGSPRLEHPYTTRLHYMPPMWYRPHWPKMPAFALPSFADGAVRLNLKGRESRGMVHPADAARLRQRLARLLLRLKDSRTGDPAVAEIVVPEGSAEAGGPDLVARWSDRPIDTVDCAEHGRIGPLPFRQSGGHRSRGFFAIAGSGIAPRELPAGHLVDIAPTILALMGLTPPNHLEGRADALLGDCVAGIAAS